MLINPLAHKSNEIRRDQKYDIYLSFLYLCKVNDLCLFILAIFIYLFILVSLFIHTASCITKMSYVIKYHKQDTCE